MKTAIVSHQGYTEDLEDPSGGEHLYFKVTRTFSGKDVMTVVPYEWDHDPKKIVGMLKRNGFEEIVSISYSWGAGYGAMRLAKEAIKAGLRVRLMLLCDPVFRANWLPSWGPASLFSGRSLFRRSAKIKVPAGAEKVAMCYQTNSVLSGHALKVSPGTKVLATQRLPDERHGSIDASEEWFRMVKHHLSNELA